MELREPPRVETPVRRGLLALALLANVALGVALAFALWSGAPGSGGQDAERLREVAGKLKAAGVLDESASLYAEYLAAADVSDESKGKIAFSLGVGFFDRGLWGEALRWFYEAEEWGAGSLEGELGRKIVASLERLGQSRAASAALDARTRLRDSSEVARSAEDPVVATIGDEPIYRSQVESAMAALPPQAAQQMLGLEARQQFLQSYVAEELIWRKAKKLGYDSDPAVRSLLTSSVKQLVVGKFLEREVLEELSVDEVDLRAYFAANAERYSSGEDEEDPGFEEARPVVERDYRLEKFQAAYEELVKAELSAARVELHVERMGG